MKTNVKVFILDYNNRGMFYDVAPNALCLKGQLASITRDISRFPVVRPFSPKDVSSNAEEIVGYFAEDACNPIDLTFVYQERPI
jgi:hypothetical protein